MAEAQEEQAEQTGWDDIPEPVQVPVPEKNENTGIEAELKPEETHSEVQEESSTNWQKRYKDIEASHSRRGNELHAVKRERDDIRLEKLEMQQQIQEVAELKRQLSNLENERSSQPDPLDDERYWDEEEKEVLKEYPEIVKVADKLAHRKVEIALRNNGKEDSNFGDKYKSEITDLKKQVQEQRNYIAREQAFAQLDQLCTSAWRQADNNPEFHDYVNKSRVLRKAMTDGDLEDKAEVFNQYLSNHKVSSEIDTGDKAKAVSEGSDQERRKAAQGLVRGTTPKVDQSARPMVGQELWDSIPEHE